jgi:hypothetical protein
VEVLELLLTPQMELPEHQLQVAVAVEWVVPMQVMHRVVAAVEQ